MFILQLDPNTVLAVHANTQQLHKEYVKLRMEVERKFDEVGSLMKQVRMGLFFSVFIMEFFIKTYHKVKKRIALGNEYSW